MGIWCLENENLVPDLCVLSLGWSWEEGEGINPRRDAARWREVCEREMGRGLKGEKFMTKREKEGEMNEEGAEGGWLESGMNEQRYSGAASRGLIQRLSHIPSEQPLPCSELGTRAIPAKSPGAVLSPSSPCQGSMPGAGAHPWARERG